MLVSVDRFCGFTERVSETVLREVAPTYELHNYVVVLSPAYEKEPIEKIARAVMTALERKEDGH